MSATFELFTRWRSAKGFTTDAEAARYLRIHVSTITPWKLHGRNGSPAVIERMAKDLGEDPVPTILKAFSEAARDAEDRKTLGRLARSVGAACLALLMLAPWTQQASAHSHRDSSAAAHPIHYAKWRIAARRRLQAWFRAFAEYSPCSPLALHPARP